MWLERMPGAADPIRGLDQVLRGSMKHLSLVFCAGAFSTPAFAHIGHVGEVAGHTHIIAIGATIAAAALAGLVAKAMRGAASDNKADTDEPVADVEPEADGKPA